ncbi:ataxin-1 [Cylas formicarius]|uniref:ataxin-1 n=1 Tax=Cylas formicarius TaxID=197179 RepID=UPI0029588543|nr:ataxin-1 [Cylas formicarius]XP_060535084.1 ataxin-1 [Cylas formicarius]XP_060535085.1 ataxin-1 [Cylas formicarius]XP_060535086.1 ataxin-1 [Cylas formicarius]XP_060535087.1 ataxin-1 [Cylas formicarius]
MISAGIESRLLYMTYPEPWRNPPKQPPEVFLRPAPKLLPSAARGYNGAGAATTYPNGTRLAPSRPSGKYSSPPSSAVPVNLAKVDEPDEPLTPYSPYRLFSHGPQYSSFPYSTLCQQPYMIRTPSFPPTPLSPQDMFSPGTPTASSTATFLPPPAAYSPPSGVAKTNQTTPREKNTPTQLAGFKVPSGKEGSMKHRLLTRPDAPLDLQKVPEGRRRLQATQSPPRSPKRPPNGAARNFNRGQLIQLASGEFRKVEDMRTEDFVQSAEKSPALRLAESTVVRIEERGGTGVVITLTYDDRKAQVEVNSNPEHPYFVMGQGWASCNPDLTHQCHGLKVHRLHVGDVLVSLTPRETPNASQGGGATVVTTATTTSMTARQYPVAECGPYGDEGARKRRWSAPDQIGDGDASPPKRRAD